MRAFAVLILLGCLEGCAFSHHEVPPSAVVPKPVPCIVRKAEPSPQVLMRVAILTRQSVLRLQTPENFSLTGFTLTPAETASKTVTLDVTRLTSDVARLHATGSGGLKVNGQSYMGVLEIYPDQGGTLTVVNELGLEDYVIGVLVGEVPRDWPIEALKAQAIAARTFALKKREEARADHRPWDLENHALFQVYKGSGDACENMRNAVSSCKGKVLTWGGKLINAFYHSNCGGQTCRASDVWGTDLPYLQSVECRYCESGPHYRWSTIVSTMDVSRKLREAHIWIGDVAQILPLEEDDSGRVSKVALVDTEGHRKEMKGNVFRNALGADVLRCTRLRVELQSEGFQFHGRGWGHGVGMCQEGACGMAQAGFRASEILRKYYPGALIESMDGL